MLEARHPGEILRKDYLEPRGYTVTEAAKQLGVTRQALNNLVNCKSIPSRDMQFRIARLLNLTPEQVQGWQTAYELGDARSQATRRRRVRGDSLAPRASHISDWASRTKDARYLLPRLIRLLVCSSTGGSGYCRFPAQEEIQFPGFDA